MAPRKTMCRQRLRRWRVPALYPALPPPFPTPAASSPSTCDLSNPIYRPPGARTRRTAGHLDRSPGPRSSLSSAVSEREFGARKVVEFIHDEHHLKPAGAVDDAGHDPISAAEDAQGPHPFRALELVIIEALIGSEIAFGDASVRQDLLAWLGCHNRALTWLGGVPASIRIDNLKTDVAQGAGAWAVLLTTACPARFASLSRPISSRWPTTAVRWSRKAVRRRTQRRRGRHLGLTYHKPPSVAHRCSRSVTLR